MGETVTKKELFSVELPGRVVVKKNSKRMLKLGGRLVPVSSDKYKAWENRQIYNVLQAKARYGIKNSIWQPLHAEFQFHFRNRASLPDTSNCIEGPQDLLERCGVYSNDRQIESIKATRLISGQEKTIVSLYEGES